MLVLLLKVAVLLSVGVLTLPATMPPTQLFVAVQLPVVPLLPNHVPFAAWAL